MEEDNSFKINFITLLIILMVIIAIVVLLVMFGKNNGKSVNTSKVNNANTTQNKVEPVNKKYANTDFSFDFLKMENNGKNIIYSPLSIKYALKMLEDGASGDTQKQIKELIGSESVQKYNNIDNILSLANSFFIRDTYSRFVTEDYKNLLINNYNAEIKEDTFNDAKEINNWIKNKTLGQIDDIVKDSVVQNPDCKIVLINALAIDMEWKEPFSENSTYGDDFFLEDGREIQATMMNKKVENDTLSYYLGNEETIISMDLEEYDDAQMEFVAIMPNYNLSEYLDSFSLDKLDTLSKKMRTASETRNGVDISIPKFSYDYDLQLKADLIGLGVKNIFDPDKADFSPMVKSSEIYVSDALHKANIDFSEKGVKAAAVTVIIMTDGALFEEEKPIEININNPFLYVIRDKKTKEIWFVGAVYEPNHWENDKADYQVW